MEIKQLIVKEYLESLTEKNELNKIFPILLESMGFVVLSKPTEYIGLKEYGKDIVAVGKDENGIKCKFYFELKGGNDRNITEANFYGKDGIQVSITEAAYNEFFSSYPEFSDLPKKVIIVHNGVVDGTLQYTLENLLINVTKTVQNTSFDRWDISRLTGLFSDYLFGIHLLTDKETIRLFNRVIVNLNTYDEVNPEFDVLLNKILEKHSWKAKGTISRHWIMVFETLKLIALIIHTESKEYNNLLIAKKYFTHLVLKFWYWALKNKAEKRKKVKQYFDEVFNYFMKILTEYNGKILPFAVVKDGLFTKVGGRYEQVGYTIRALDFVQNLCFVIKVLRSNEGNKHDEMLKQKLIQVINANSVTARPLLDIHSIPIIDIIQLLIDFDDLVSAKHYLRFVIAHLKWGKENHDRLPDASNNIKSVIRLMASRDKSVFYSDNTSPLLAVVFEFIVVLDMEEDYYDLRSFVSKYKIHLGIFVPHDNLNRISYDLREDTENDLEEQLFSKSVRDGYQSEIRLRKLELKAENEELTFEEFKNKMKNRKKEFCYEYRTDKAGYPYLKDLAHYYYKTPYFTDKWRGIKLKESENAEV